ncbi:MAG: NAD(P)-dependent alcohol dehydrogenase [Labilithrix sp.]|nr:NAD(P)-dependent alcohol dehydrogenase [Labilithrix sp.]
MRAVVYERYGAPDVLELRDVPTPTPRRREVLVEVRATSVTSADVRLRALDVPPGFGLFARLAFGVFRPRQRILGVELAGVVVAIGEEVRRFAVGDAVFGLTGARMGCHAEYRALPEDGALARIPEGLDFEQAAALPFGGTTALELLRRANVRSGERVLVNGASGCVGAATVQLAKHLGAHVTGVSSTANLALLRALGADEVVDYTRGDFTGNGESYDVIVDTVGTATFSRCRRSLEDGGRLVLAAAGLPEMLAIPWVAMTTNARIIAGPVAERAEDVTRLAELAAKGRLEPVIDRVYPLEHAAKAHAYVDSKRKRGSVIVRV